jgi:UDP-glucose 4-epimerase
VGIEVTAQATESRSAGDKQRPRERELTVAVTGPTGDIGRALMRALDRVPTVERVIGMARSPFDPAEAGLAKAEYRRGDILDREEVETLVADADVVVHLAFIIFGGREETREVNLEGTRNVFEAAARREVARLVYTSSVAAYGFHPDNPQPLTEEVEPRGSEEFYYSAQKAELEQLLRTTLAGTATEAYVFRPCIVAGEDALAVIETLVGQLELGGRLSFLRRALDELPILAPVLPDPGAPFQLVHHDDVADALVAAIVGRGKPATYNLAGEGELRVRDLARAMGWYSVPVPSGAVDALAEAIRRLPFLPPEASWINSVRVPMLMNTARARRELGWRPSHDAADTLLETIDASRREGILR